MRSIISVCIFNLLFVASSYGQIHKVNLVDEDYKFKEVRAYDIVQVIDARNDRNSIGFVQKGISNKKRLADFELGFEKELETFFDQSVLHWDQTLPVLFKFNQLKIWEKTNFSSEFAYVTLDVDAYLISDQGYKYISSFKSSYESRGMDVTGKHEHNIIKALELVLDDLSAIDIMEVADSRASRSEKHIKGTTQEDEINQLTITKDRLLNKGLYRTFEEFSNNNPSVISGYTVEMKPRKQKEWQDTYDITITDSSTGKKIKQDLWGFSDGEFAYIYFEKEFYVINISEGEVFFDAMHQPGNGATTAAIAGGAIGGLVGGAIGGGVAALATKTQKKRMNISSSGSIFPTSSAPAPLEDVTVYLYRPHKKEHTSEIEVRDSQQLLASFKPGMYIEVQPTSDQVMAFQAKLSQGDKHAQLKVLPDKHQIYIEVSYSAKSVSDEPVIRQVDHTIGEFYVNRFRNLRNAQ